MSGIVDGGSPNRLKQTSQRFSDIYHALEFMSKEVNRLSPRMHGHSLNANQCASNDGFAASSTPSTAGAQVRIASNSISHLHHVCRGIGAGHHYVLVPEVQ